MSFVYFNPNPKARRVGDCSVRAVCKALEQDWDTSFLGITVIAMKEYDMPSANYIWGNYLVHQGFTRIVIPNNCPMCSTVREFADSHENGTYVLACDGDHVVTVVDGDYYDTWDSGDSVVLYFYKKNEEE